MSKKRKADNDQHTTLLDFFNAGGSANLSIPEKTQVSKKQKTSSTKAGSSTNGSNVSGSKVGKANAKHKAMNVLPDGTEVIELFDSDEELQVERMSVRMSVGSLSQTPERPLFKRMNAGPNEIVDLTGDDIDMEGQRPPYIDCSDFFLDSPGRVGEGDDELEVSTSLKRMSPAEWGVGDDEGFSDGAGAGTGASEPEDDTDETALQDQPKQETVFDMDEEMEEEPTKLQVIELSDDDESDVQPSRSSKEFTCPICLQEFSDILNSVRIVTASYLFN
jgi:hypothetical protein